MDWSNERYVRIYVRDTKTWKLLGWEGQAVLCLLARRFDRSGLLDDVRDAEDVALMIGYGFPVETAEVGLKRLLEPGKSGKPVLIMVESGLFWPNFMEAQETAMSDAQRQRESRAKRRARAAVTRIETENMDIDITGDFTPDQAHGMVNRAILNGVLIRGVCENCGTDRMVDGHHDDYSMPLHVRWLCKSCHKKLHCDTKSDKKADNDRSCHEVTAPVTPTRAVPYCTIPTSTEEPPLTPPGGNAREKYSREFEDFRSKYPAHRRGGKLQDWKSWKVAKRAGMAADVAHEYLGYWIASPKWKNGYIVAFSKWLRDGYWETMPADEEPPTNGRGVDKVEESRQRSLEALGWGGKK